MFVHSMWNLSILIITFLLNRKLKLISVLNVNTIMSLNDNINTSTHINSVSVLSHGILYYTAISHVIVH